MKKTVRCFAEGKGPSGPILKRESLEEMWKPQFTKDTNGVGLGFFVGEHSGKRHIGHNGAMYGFATELGYLPDEKLGAIVAVIYRFTQRKEAAGAQTFAATLVMLCVLISILPNAIGDRKSTRLNSSHRT